MFSAANVLEFARTALIIYRGPSFKQLSIVSASVWFSFGVTLFLWSSDDFICVRVWRLSWQRRHIWEQEQAGSMRGGRVGNRLPSARLITHTHAHTIIFPLFTHPVSFIDTLGALKIPSLCAVSTSLFAWRYSERLVLGCSQVWLKRGNRISRITTLKIIKSTLEKKPQHFCWNRRSQEHGS